MKCTIKDSVLKIQTSNIKEFDEKISKIDDIIELTLGEPCFSAPNFIQEAAEQAIYDGKTKYSSSNEVYELREKISTFINEKYSLKYDPESEIIVNVDASEALMVSLFIVITSNTKVIIPTPFYSPYIEYVKLCGGIPILFETESNNFKIDPEKLNFLLSTEDDISTIILNSPTNSTGLVYSEEELNGIASIIRKHEITVISDEIYSELCYEKKHYSFSSIIRDKTIVINGFSKSISMTGWRVVYICADRYYIDEIAKVHQLLVSCNPTSNQYAAMALLNYGKNDVKKFTNHYKENVMYMCNALEKLNFSVCYPESGFYVFAKLPEIVTMNSIEYCDFVAENAKVAFLPGEFFGDAYKRYIRVNCSENTEILMLAINQISELMNSIYTENKFIGRHYLIEVYGVSTSLLNNSIKIKKLFNEAILLAKMQKIGESFHEFTPQGITGIMLLQESHISIHTWPELQYASLDLYSCGNTESLAKAVKYIKNELKPLHTEVQFIDRASLHKIADFNRQT